MEKHHLMDLRMRSDDGISVDHGEHCFAVLTEGQGPLYFVHVLPLEHKGQPDSLLLTVPASGPW